MKRTTLRTTPTDQSRKQLILLNRKEVARIRQQVRVESAEGRKKTREENQVQVRRLFHPSPDDKRTFYRQLVEYLSLIPAYLC